MQEGETHSSASDMEENWDQDSIVVDVKPRSEARYHGYHIIPSCAPEEPTPKKFRKHSCELHPGLIHPEVISSFSLNWSKNEPFIKNSIELIADPFRVCIVDGLLDRPISSKLVEDFNELCWNKRSLDLYEFFQSADLKHVNAKYIGLLYDFLKSEVRMWLEALTGHELGEISATCSVYGDTDYLLLHDDQQEDRLIAFVYYIGGPRAWEAKNGGALQLFAKDGDGQPFCPVRDVLPADNRFVFFQVTSDSYHQVSEVTNRDDCRMSVNGWFHYKKPGNIPVFATPVYTPPSTGLFSKTATAPREMDVELESWVNPDYLDPDTLKDIQEYMEELSEVSLSNFFKREAFDEVLADLRRDDVRWSRVGPPNRRLYEVASEQDLPSVLGRFLGLFQSAQMFRLLKDCTDLDLGAVRYELQRWRPGCYSLLTDYDWDERNELDLVLYLGCPGTAPAVGARTVYVATEDEVEQALTTLEPEENKLNIVYRDTARFTKYMSKYSRCSVFYLLICSYSV